jgi:aryl-alcohol dehydrogenase-like predicted oxidoreductase
VPLEDGIAAVDDLRSHVPDDLSLAQCTLRWILDFDAVSTVIPGSTNPAHIRSNIAASDRAPLSHQIHGAIRDIYERTVKEHVHHRW